MSISSIVAAEGGDIVLRPNEVTLHNLAKNTFFLLGYVFWAIGSSKTYNCQKSEEEKKNKDDVHCRVLSHGTAAFCALGRRSFCAGCCAEVARRRRKFVHRRTLLFHLFSIKEKFVEGYRHHAVEFDVRVYSKTEVIAQREYENAYRDQPASSIRANRNRRSIHE